MIRGAVAGALEALANAVVPAPLRELHARLDELHELHLPRRVAELERSMDALEARMDEHDVGTRPGVILEPGDEAA